MVLLAAAALALAGCGRKGPLDLPPIRIAGARPPPRRRMPTTSRHGKAEPVRSETARCADDRP